MVFSESCKQENDFAFGKRGGIHFLQPQEKQFFQELNDTHHHLKTVNLANDTLVLPDRVIEDDF